MQDNGTATLNTGSFSIPSITHLRAGTAQGTTNTMAQSSQTSTEVAIHIQERGAGHGRVPILGDGWAFFYQSLISVIPSSPDAQSKRNLDPLRSDGVEPRLTRTSSNNVFCCVASSMCVLIPSYDLPACYDKFTTNYFLSDGSHGTVSNGSYETADGGWANLVTGEYSLTDGTQGNIYANDPANAPDSNSVPVPTPFTSSGVGSAIPGSELGTVSSASATAVSSVVHTSSLATNTPPSPTDISTTWSTPGLTNSSVGTAPTGTVPAIAETVIAVIGTVIVPTVTLNIDIAITTAAITAITAATPTATTTATTTDTTAAITITRYRYSHLGAPADAVDAEDD
ncbi:hypothetical protein DV738_g2912, partial [Chaetothyriales sp. CBS 135597]